MWLSCICINSLMYWFVNLFCVEQPLLQLFVICDSASNFLGLMTQGMVTNTVYELGVIDGLSYEVIGVDIFDVLLECPHLLD